MAVSLQETERRHRGKAMCDGGWRDEATAWQHLEPQEMEEAGRTRLRALGGSMARRR